MAGKIEPAGAQPLTLPERIDIAVVDRLSPWLRTPAARMLGQVGEVGDKPPLRLLAGTLLATGLLRGDRTRARAGLRMLLAHSLAVAVVQLGKDRIERSRPRRLMEDHHYRFAWGRSKKPSLRSFPSGHTAGSVAMASAYAADFPAHAAPALAAASTVGALQTVRRAHFPTDILAGAVVGLAAAGLARWLLPPAR